MTVVEEHSINSFIIFRLKRVLLFMKPRNHKGENWTDSTALKNFCLAKHKEAKNITSKHKKSLTTNDKT